jgi:tetratricopeptide (TPR) repeat protein
MSRLTPRPIIAAAVLLLAGVCLFGFRWRHGNEAVNPSDQISRGWRYFQAGEFSLATDQFQSACDQLRSRVIAADPVLLEARFGLAQSWDLGRRDEGGPAIAAPIYQQIVTADPTGDLAAWCLLAMARSQHLSAPPESDPVNVLALYQTVVDRFPRHPAGEEAFMYIQIIRLLSNPSDEQSNRVLASLEQFVQHHAESKFISEAYMLQANCLDRLGKPREKLAAMEKAFQTREVDTANPRMDNAAPYWSLATTAEFDAGDFPTARKYYNLLRNQYPNDQRSFPALQQLRRMDDIEAAIRGGVSTTIPNAEVER